MQRSLPNRAFAIVNLGMASEVAAKICFALYLTKTLHIGHIHLRFLQKHGNYHEYLRKEVLELYFTGDEAFEDACFKNWDSN